MNNWLLTTYEHQKRDKGNDKFEKKNVIIINVNGEVRVRE